jgi:hypothetical protein
MASVKRQIIVTANHYWNNNTIDCANVYYSNLTVRFSFSGINNWAKSAFVSTNFS